jgi:heme-degrading monooxygenase HmoA
VYSRVTQLEIDTVRSGVDEAVAIFRNQVAPLLREQEGYEGGYVFVTPEGKALLITFWETAEAAAETPFYGEQMAKHVTLFKSPPGRERYEVVYADAPLVTSMQV